MKETFIGQYYLDDLSICDDIIEYFKNSPDKNLGKVGFGEVDKNIKDSTDLYLESVDLSNRYNLQLQQTLNKYIEQYSFCNKYESNR